MVTAHFFFQPLNDANRLAYNGKLAVKHIDHLLIAPPSPDHEIIGEREENDEWDELPEVASPPILIHEPPPPVRKSLRARKEPDRYVACLTFKRLY